MSYILSMDVTHLYNLVLKAQEKSEREDLFSLYSSSFPHLQEGVSFEDFVSKFKVKKEINSNDSIDNIMNNILKVGGKDHGTI